MKLNAIVLLLLGFMFPQTYAQDMRELETIRQRVVTDILEQQVNESSIKEWMKALNAEGKWESINYEDVSRTAFQNYQHLKRLASMSIAYIKEGSRLKGDPNLRKEISLGLDYWIKNDFICENWWFNEIGSPDQLTIVLLLMEKELTKEQIEETLRINSRANITDSFGAKGGDRVKIAAIYAKNMLVERNIEKFAWIMKEIESEIKFARRGMQYDYSFHHREDRVNNTFSYGMSYTEAFVEWATYVEGTSYQFSDKAKQHLIDYYLDGVCKMMVYGKRIDTGVINRDITRLMSHLPYSSEIPEKLLQISSYRKDELQRIAENRRNDAQHAESFSKFFWQTDHYVHQRPGYYTSVRMYSTRNHNMECPYNSEGLKNHHRGDGTNYLSLTGLEYLNMAPVYDWQKIPGATVLQKPGLPSEEEIQKPGLTDFVGAVSDGKYGVVGFDFISPHDPLKARKSWFFFDNEYVCLGAGIHAESHYPVATTLNQCLLNGDIWVSKEGKTGKLSAGETRIAHPDWIYHDHVAYIFPQPATVSIAAESRTGTWQSVTKQFSLPKEPVTHKVFKAWIDHGKTTREETYQYIVLPGTSVDKIQNWLTHNPIEIVCNTSAIQSVRHRELEMIQAVFYKEGEITWDNTFKLRMHSPGIVLLKMENNVIKEISVADPSHQLDRLSISVSGRWSPDSAGTTSRWDEQANETEISIKLPEKQWSGKSITIKL